MSKPYNLDSLKNLLKDKISSYAAGNTSGIDAVHEIDALVDLIKKLEKFEFDRQLAAAPSRPNRRWVSF